MKSPKQPFVLFFVAGMVPTAKELQTAAKLRARIGYRNASVVNEGDTPEPCDGVAGAVPAQYKKYPTAEQAIAAFDKKLDEAAATADATVGKPPERKPGPGAGEAPKGFENLPGGNGATGAPNPPAGAGEGGKPADDGKPATGGDESKKPQPWGGTKK